MQQVSKFDINPATGKQYGINPATGVQDDNYWASKVDPVVNSQFKQQQQGEQAQQQYQQQQAQAVGGLQQKKTDLAGQYSDLLKTVTGEYQPLINQTTATAGAELSRRGLTPDSTLFQQQTQGALQPVYGAEAANAQQIGQGSISDTNSLAAQIAQLQQGGAQFGAQLPLQYGQLALQQQQQPFQNALLSAQAGQVAGQNPTQLALARIAQQYQPVSAGNFLLNMANNSYVNPSQLMQATGYAAGNFGVPIK